MSAFESKVTWVAGNMDRGFADGKTGVAEFHFPYGLTRVKDAKTDDDLLLVADGGNNRVRAINAKANAVTTFAGTGKEGSANGPANAAEFRCPNGITTDRVDGSVLVTESRGNTLRRIRAGVVSTVAGSGHKGFVDGPALQAQFHAPSDVLATHNGSGVVYIADSGNARVRALHSSTNTVTTVAGNGKVANSDGKALESALHGPRYMCFDTVSARPDTVLYVTTTGAIRRLDTVAGTVTTLALPPKKAFDPHGVACTPSGAVLFSCFKNNSLYVIEQPHATGELKVEPLAGTGVNGFYDGIAARASFNHPDGLLLDTDNQLLFISDCGNDRIRRMTLSPHLFVAKPRPMTVDAAPTAVATGVSPSVAVTTNDVKVAVPVTPGSTPVAAVLIPAPAPEHGTPAAAGSVTTPASPTASAPLLAGSGGGASEASPSPAK